MFDAEAKYIPLEAIIDYLTGSATQQTLDEVSEWCAFSPENETYFVQMKEIWFSIVAERRNDFDQQLAFEEFKVSVQRLMGNKPFAPVKASPMRKLLSIAAAVLAVVAVGVIAWFIGYNARPDASGRIVVRAPEGSQTFVLLPDSSEVHLNAGSKLVYSQGYGVSNRRVSLEGEALFSVHKNKDLPFVVWSKDFEVCVTGTKFNFQNYFNDDEATVVLLQGSVAINDPVDHHQLATLTPARRYIFDKKTGVGRISTVDTARVARWTRGQLFFDEKILGDIAKDLERSHHVNVVIANDSLRARRFYGSFALTDNAADIVRTLALTGGIRYRVKGNNIMIY